MFIEVKNHMKVNQKFMDPHEGLDIQLGAVAQTSVQWLQVFDPAVEWIYFGSFRTKHESQGIRCGG